MKEYMFLPTEVVEILERHINARAKEGWTVHTFDVLADSVLRHGRVGTEAWCLLARDRMPEPQANPISMETKK